jgi:hypothetical protein
MIKLGPGTLIWPNGDRTEVASMSFTEEKKCPVCGAPCTREEVDIGVGVQVGPWRCTECDWDEDYKEVIEE